MESNKVYPTKVSLPRSLGPNNDNTQRIKIAYYPAGTMDRFKDTPDCFSYLREVVQCIIVENKDATIEMDDK